MAEEKDFNNIGLVNIGQPPGIPSTTPNDQQYNDYMKTCMRVVDIIPLYFEIQLASLFTDPVNGQIRDDIIKLNYPWGIAEYNRKLTGINHPDANNVYGARVWITSGSTVEETVSNEYKDNAITELYNSTVKPMAETASMLHRNLQGRMTDPRMGGISAGLLDAKQISMPKIWQSTDYSPSINFTVKLTSPYGDAKSYKKNIVRPLLALLALVSPSSTDGITYGLPPYFTVKAYGSTHMNLATISNITINRGGGETRFNAKKQPLEVEISMSFAPALPGFGAMVAHGEGNGSFNDIAKFDDVDLPFGLSGDSEIRDSIPGVVTLGAIVESLRPANPSTISSSSIGGVDFLGNLFTDVTGFDPDAWESTLIKGGLDALVNPEEFKTQLTNATAQIGDAAETVSNLLWG